MTVADGPTWLRPTVMLLQAAGDLAVTPLERSRRLEWALSSRLRTRPLPRPSPGSAPICGKWGSQQRRRGPCDPDSARPPGSRLGGCRGVPPLQGAVRGGDPQGERARRTAAPGPPAVALRPLHPLEALSLLAVTLCGKQVQPPAVWSSWSLRGPESGGLWCRTGLGRGCVPRRTRTLGASGGWGPCSPGLRLPELLLAADNPWRQPPAAAASCCGAGHGAAGWGLGSELTPWTCRPYHATNSSLSTTHAGLVFFFLTWLLFPQWWLQLRAWKCAFSRRSSWPLGPAFCPLLAQPALGGSARSMQQQAEVGGVGARGQQPGTRPRPDPLRVTAPLPSMWPDLLRQVLLQVLHHPQVWHREGGARVRALLRAAEQVSPSRLPRGPSGLRGARQVSLPPRSGAGTYPPSQTCQPVAGVCLLLTFLVRK